MLGTIYFGGRIIYSAIPYNGHLSWKLDELWKKREVDFVHDNFFEDGIEGILTDLEEKLEMPKNLYVVNGFKMSFNETGKVQTLDTFLYAVCALGRSQMRFSTAAMLSRTAARI